MSSLEPSIYQTLNNPEKITSQIPSSNKKRVVIIGGGFAGIQLVKDLKNKGFQVVLFDRNNYHTFQPLLYQVATAGLEPDSIAGPLRQLFKDYKDFYFRMANVTQIDAEHNYIRTIIGNISYDYLIIANGSMTNYFGNKQIMEKAFPLKQVPHALDLRSQLLQNFEKALLIKDEEEYKSLMNIVIVGGGPTGVEVAGALGELKNHVLPKDYPELDFTKMGIYLVEGQNHLLNGMSQKSGARARKYLEKFGVNVLLQKMVKSYCDYKVVLNDESEIPAQTLIWAAGVTGNIIDGLKDASPEKGRLLTDPFNKVKGYDNIFAIGDIALNKTDDYPQGHPMVAPVAIQQAKNLAGNLIRIQKNQFPKPFKYIDKGSMATIGRNRAVVDMPGNVKFSGLFAWFIWMFVHLISIIGFRNKLVIFWNWVWNYFTYDRGTRLIIRKFIPKI